MTLQTGTESLTLTMNCQTLSPAQPGLTLLLPAYSKSLQAASHLVQRQAAGLLSQQNQL